MHPLLLRSLRCREVCHIMLHFSCIQVHLPYASSFTRTSLAKFRITTPSFIRPIAFLSIIPFVAVQCRHMDRNIITFSVEFIHCLCMMDTSWTGSMRNRQTHTDHIRTLPFQGASLHWPPERRWLQDRSRPVSFLPARCPAKAFFAFSVIFRDISVLFVFLHPVDTADNISGMPEAYLQSPVLLRRLRLLPVY